jgi:glycosyltransferase involved in cell wall biosynthesis
MKLRRECASVGEELDVVIVNQVPSTCLIELAAALGERGHRVRLVTGATAATTAMTNVVSVPLVDYAPQTALGRLRSWLSFTILAARYLLGVRADTVVVTCTNPPTMPFVTVAVSAIRRFAVIVRVLDVYPDVLRAVPFPGWRLVAWVYGAVNRWTYARCAVVMTLGATTAETLSKYVGRSNIHVIPEWVSPACEVPGERGGGFGSPVVVIASGNVGATHDITPLLAAAERMRGEPVRFLISTKNSSRLPPALARAANVELHPHLPDDEYVRLLDSADVAFVSQREFGESCSFPSRVLTYLSHALPVLAMSGRPSDLAALLDQQGCGIVVSPNEASEGVANALARLCADPETLGVMRNAAAKTSHLFARSTWLPEFLKLVEQTGVAHRLAAGLSHHA